MVVQPRIITVRNAEELLVYSSKSMANRRARRGEGQGEDQDGHEGDTGQIEKGEECAIPCSHA